MAWASIASDVRHHPKQLGLPLETFAVWTLCLCWSNHYLTAGFLPDYMVTSLCRECEVDQERPVKQLLERGLWTVEGNGYLIHDFESYNQSHEEIKARREEVSESRRAAGRAGAAKRWAAKHPDLGISSDDPKGDPYFVPKTGGDQVQNGKMANAIFCHRGAIAKNGSLSLSPSIIDIDKSISIVQSEATVTSEGSGDEVAGDNTFDSVPFVQSTEGESDPDGDIQVQSETPTGVIEITPEPSKPKRTPPAVKNVTRTNAKWEWLRVVPSDMVLLADFYESFYDEYPRHKAATEGWNAIKRLAKEPGYGIQWLIDNRRTLVLALRRAKANDAQFKKGTQFIPLIATWLNGRRWTDECDTQDDPQSAQKPSPKFGHVTPVPQPARFVNQEITKTEKVDKIDLL